VIILQADRLSKGLTLAPQSRVVLAPYIQPIIAMDPDGVPKPLFNAAGVFPVTEASAAGIAQYTSYANLLDRIPHGTIAPNPYAGLPWELRLGRATITADGAGAFANQELVPALAGYYGVCRLKSIKADAGVAAGILTFESPAGTPALPSVEVQPALTANVRRDDTGSVVTHATLVDNQAIVVDGAGFGAGVHVTLEWEYWYET